MKHPVSVAELLELHHLGELYVKWASNPVAMSEADIEELQKLSDMYSINGTSALFAFQKQFQQEFGLTAANTVSIHEVAKEVLAIAEAQRQMEYDGSLITNAVETTGYIKPVLDPELEAMRAKLHEDTERVTHVLDSDGFLKPTGAEMDEALREQLHEDNEVDRESQAMRAREIRRELDVLSFGEDRYLELLKELTLVDELTPGEEDDLKRLTGQEVSIEIRQPVQDSGTHRIPTDVLAEAVGGNEKGN